MAATGVCTYTHTYCNPLPAVPGFRGNKKWIITYVQMWNALPGEAAGYVPTEQLLCISFRVATAMAFFEGTVISMCCSVSLSPIARS